MRGFQFLEKNTLCCNTVANNSDKGIYLSDTKNNTLSANIVANNGWFGIGLFDSDNNTLSGNTVTNNSYYGIKLDSSSNYNRVLFNDFSDNNSGYSQAADDGSNNIFADGNWDGDSKTTFPSWALLLLLSLITMFSSRLRFIIEECRPETV
ncbi:MAG: NosD domain-containing protein [Candidatus Hodarchaeales archaeon]